MIDDKLAAKSYERRKRLVKPVNYGGKSKNHSNAVAVKSEVMYFLQRSITLMNRRLQNEVHDLELEDGDDEEMANILNFDENQ